MVYEFGNCALDTSKRQLTRGGDAVPLAPKTFDLLLLLVESGGRALTKAEVMQALWPDTFVEEANLSFQVSTLRKVLGEDAARWIETVPKHGYRFAAPVAAIQRTPAAAPRPRYLWFAVAVMAAVVLAILVASGRRTGAGSSPRGPVPLTAYPGVQTGPSLSPDSSQVAFAWNGPNEDNFDIYVKLVGPGDSVRLTTDAARDIAPSWSPNGRQIAFLRLVSRQQASVIVIPALGGGVERKLADLTFPILRRDTTVSWTADSTQLAVSGKLNENEAFGIWLVPLEGGSPRRLTTVDGAALFDVAPAVSPDGRSLTFIRVLSSTSTDLYIQRLSDTLKPLGNPVALTSDHGPYQAVAWLDNTRVVACIGRGQAQRRLRIIETASGRATEPAGFGEGAVALSIGRNGHLVYARQQADANLYQFDLSAPSERPRRLAASTFQNWTPALSHDGRKIAFASTRSGLEEIWVAGADGSHPTQLTRMGTGHTANPRWSPDDRTLVFNSWGPRSDIFTVDVNHGEVKRLTEDPADEVEPSWSRDGKWIYCASSRTGRLEVHRLPAGGGALQQITRNGGAHAEESMDGQWLYYSKNADSPGSIWKVPVGGGEETLVIAGLSYSTNFMPVANGIYFVSIARGPEGSAIEFYDFASRRQTVLTKLDKPFTWGLALSPDGRSLVHPLMERVSSNLMLVENFR